MKKFIRYYLTITALFAASIFPQESFDLTGSWVGKLSLPNTVKLTVVFNFQKNDDGSFTATMDSPDQGVKGIETKSTIIKNDSVFVDIAIIMGSFTGKIIYDSLMIDGVWKQSGLNLDLVLRKVEKVEEVKRPQEPKEPFPYKVEEIKFDNVKDGITLVGTLTLPETGNNFPAVILISGSGGQNRDEELLGHKPFKVIADHLTKNGFAVLRFDDRGIAESTGDFSAATTEDFVTDALSAVDYLKTRNEIDHSKIGLIGHSEGGLVAPMAAVESDDVAFIVLMAGPGIPGDSILILQIELISRAEGQSEEDIEESLSVQRELTNLIKKYNDKEELEAKVRETFENAYVKMTEEEKKEFGDAEGYLETQLKTITSPWFRFFVQYDPVPTLEKVNCPVLAINGEKDLQVPPNENLSAIETALSKAGNNNFEVKMLEGLNHLFQTSSTGAISEYGIIEETISPLALNTMSDWLEKVTSE